MSTITLARQAPSCPAPKPPPPPPKPSKLDERMERAIKVACQGPPFPGEVIAALRNLLPPTKGNPNPTNPHPDPKPGNPPPPVR